MLLALVVILSIVLQVRPEEATAPSKEDLKINDVQKCLNIIHGDGCPDLRYNAVLKAYSNLKAISTSQADLDKYAQDNKLDVAGLTISPVFVKKPGLLSLNATNSTPAGNYTTNSTAAPLEYTLEACTARLNLTNDTVEGLKNCSLKSYGYSYTNTSDCLVLDTHVVDKTLDSKYLVKYINSALKSKMIWDDKLCKALTDAAANGSYKIDKFIRDTYDESYVVNTDYDYLTFRGVNGERSIADNLRKNFESLDTSYYNSYIAGVYTSNDTATICLVIPPE